MQQTQPKQTSVKLLNSSRRNISKREPSHPVTRLKSSHEQQTDKLTLPQNNIPKRTLKPRPSTGKRVSSAKHTDTMNSLATTSSGKSQSEVKSMISTALCHNPKLKQFLKQRHISQVQLREKLFDNQLFTLSLVTSLSNKCSNDQVNSIIQHAIITKVKRMQNYEQQINKCNETQSRINKLIEQRLKALSNRN